MAKQVATPHTTHTLDTAAHQRLPSTTNHTHTLPREQSASAASGDSNTHSVQRVTRHDSSSSSVTQTYHIELSHAISHSHYQPCPLHHHHHVRLQRSAANREADVSYHVTRCTVCSAVWPLGTLSGQQRLTTIATSLLCPLSCTHCVFFVACATYAACVIVCPTTAP